MTESAIYGVLARFDSADALSWSAAVVREAGYQGLDAFAPYPVPGLEHALGCRQSRLPLHALVVGVMVAAGAFLLQWYSSVVDYPIVVGGKPLNSWPAFLPVTFEAGILAAVVTAMVGMLVGNGLPQPYHPVFNHEGFERASDDGFFLLVPVEQNGGIDEITSLLQSQGALEVREVAP